MNRKQIQYVPKEWAERFEKHLEEVHKQAQNYSARNVIEERSNNEKMIPIGAIVASQAAMNVAVQSSIRNAQKRREEEEKEKNDDETD